MVARSGKENFSNEVGQEEVLAVRVGKWKS